MLVMLGFSTEAAAQMTSCAAGDAPSPYGGDACGGNCVFTSGAVNTVKCGDGSTDATKKHSIAYAVKGHSGTKYSFYGTNAAGTQWCCVQSGTVNKVELWGRSTAGDNLYFYDSGTGKSLDRSSGNMDGYIYGEGGADEIHGSRSIDGSYFDHLNGGGGNDEIWGWEGDDEILCWVGLAGSDTYNMDRAYGGPGDDYIEGGTDNDELYGNEDDDTILGGSGDDSLWGGTGVDTIFGDFGVDHIYGNEGNDDLYGGVGVNHLSDTDTYGDFIYGCTDTDLEPLPAACNNGPTADVDHLYGGGGDDYLYGQYGEDTEYGGDGDDHMYGGAHDDEMHGGDDDDELRGHAGEDHLFGDAGTDVLYGDNASGSDGQDDKLEGGPDDDFLYGNGGADVLWGGQGVDEMRGQNGDDVLCDEHDGDLYLGGTATVRNYLHHKQPDVGTSLPDPASNGVDADTWCTSLTPWQTLVTLYGPIYNCATIANSPVPDECSGAYQY